MKPLADARRHRSLIALALTTLLVVAVGVATGGSAVSLPPTPALADTAPPSTPHGLTAAAFNSGRVDLSWAASSDAEGVDGYTIYRNGKRLRSVDAASFSYRDRRVAPKRTYRYRVDAFDLAGNHSRRSALAIVTTPADDLPPRRPAGLVATAVASDHVGLSWRASADNVGVRRYVIYRNGDRLAAVPVGTQTYADGRVGPYSRYAYAIQAVDAAGNRSARSIPVVAKTTDSEPPTAPTGLTATALDAFSVRLAWTASTDNAGVVGYTVYRDGSAVTTTGGETLTITDSPVSARATYDYTVDAVDAAGNHSAVSPAASVTTPAPPQVPTTLTFSPATDTYASAASPGTNYGTQSTLNVDGSPVARSYLRFDVQGLGPSVISATLRVHADSSSSAGFAVSSVADTSWGETSLTYNNAPAVTGPAVGSSGPLAGGSWVEIDVTALVQGDGAVSLALTTTDETNMAISSRESGANSPRLVVATTSDASPPGGVVIAAAGDIVCGADTPPSPCKQMETSDLLLEINPSVVLALGDTQYEAGQYSNFVDYYEASWGRVRAITYPVAGNHEYGTTGASGYFDYFNGAGNFSGRAGDRDKGYYSFDLGSWHMVALNSNCARAGGCDVGSAQYEWLRADLATHANACTLAFFHHPLFSSGGRDSSYVKPLVQALYDDDADVVLNGHDHIYERFAPQDPNGNLDTTRGIREFVVGTGGRNLTGIAARAANSEIYNNASFGVLKLRLYADSYDWQFVPIAGSTFTDSGSTVCH